MRGEIRGCGGRQGDMRVVKKCGRVYGGECGKVRWGEGRGTGGVAREGGRVYRGKWESV